MEFRKSRSLIIYTSGSSGTPKGVVTTHLALETQIKCLIQSWGWSPNDKTIHILPLNHIHGLINVLLCSLWIGASCEFISKFNTQNLWNKIIARNFTVFMAVPKIYRELSENWLKLTPKRQEKITLACRKMRLMVSGSARLSPSLFNLWKKISGHDILERYGMTEIGMALTNPLKGKRIPGTVGRPLPNVSICIADSKGEQLPDGSIGELYVKSASLFLEYWKKPIETAAAFLNGWFKTGDIAIRMNGIYSILGRKSLDIINPNGFKISALEIESIINDYSLIKHSAIIGLPCPKNGEMVCAMIVLHPDKHFNSKKFLSWCKKRMHTSKIPTFIIQTGKLPTNVMGKTIKSQIIKEIEKIKEKDPSDPSILFHDSIN